MVLKYLVLGMLNLAPMTGYDLKKRFDSTVAHFWAADRAQIYRTLGALVSAGWATVETVEQRTYPTRHVHHITATGLAALQGWIRSPLEPEVVRDVFLARLFFAGSLDAPAVRAILAERRTEAEGMRTRLLAERERHAASSADDLARLVRLATLDNGLAHADAELSWLDHAERIIG